MLAGPLWLGAKQNKQHWGLTATSESFALITKNLKRLCHIGSPVCSSTKPGYPVCLHLIFVFPKMDFKYKPFCVWIITH